ncbi:MAG: cardiolipin synthase ClsB [Methylotenera sp.]|nr:cardiolipin synthase ClsB [Methylotenera sp.]
MIHFIKGNKIELLRNGSDYFPALATAIDKARLEIYLQTYIYADDETGKLIGDALVQAAKRGVKVHLLIDGFGSKELPRNFLQELKAGGVEARFYRPQVSPWSFKRSRLRRLHRKVVAIDGKIAFVGGINIINDCEIPDKTPPRLDYSLRIEGNLLGQITASVKKMWQRTYWTSSWTSGWTSSQLQKRTLPISSVEVLPDNDVEAAFVIRDNIFHKHDIEQAYLYAIRHAKTEIILANAYFMPGRRFRQALIFAAKRGVTVKLLLQGRMEYFLMFATHAFYNILLKNGIEIYEYREGYMHSKVAVIDDYWATVGSSNIDPFSLLLAQEANVVIRDQAFANALKEDLLSCISTCAHRVNPDRWMIGHRTKRVFSWLAYGLYKLGLGLIGRTNHH